MEFPITDQKFLAMERKFSDKYTPESFESLLNSSSFFKLSYKKQFSLKTYYNESTNFKYFSIFNHCF